MENIPKKPTVKITALMCALGHHYKVTNTITPYINEYKCCNCGREVTDDLQGQLQLLTEKSRIVNECVGSFFKKKTNRLNLAS